MEHQSGSSRDWEEGAASIDDKHNKISHDTDDGDDGDDRDDSDDSDFDDDFEVIDISLGKVSASEGRLRFDGDDTYLPRQTAVLVRCVLLDVVHGTFSATDTRPCSLLVFDFQLDKIKNMRVLHSAMITVIITGPGFKKIHAIAPVHPLNAAPLEEARESNKGGELGTPEQAFVNLKGTVNKRKSTKPIKYATARGWTQHYPKPRINDPTPHDCVKWSVQENPAEKDAGVAPHFRSAMLVERQDEESEFLIAMQIDSKADLLTEVEDFRLWGDTTQQGRRVINPLDDSTNRLKKYKTARLGAEDLSKLARYSKGKLETKLFDD